MTNPENPKIFTPHYGGDVTYETIKVMEAWSTPQEYAGFLKNNILKYASRHAKKNGQEDIDKAADYAVRFRDYVAKMGHDTVYPKAPAEPKRLYWMATEEPVSSLQEIANNAPKTHLDNAILVHSNLPPHGTYVVIISPDDISSERNFVVFNDDAKALAFAKDVRLNKERSGFRNPLLKPKPAHNLAEAQQRAAELEPHHPRPVM